ncbi:MAG: SLC13/DASS family transporter [Gammaproteobacteria bacterium]|nr:SLC13/DASS family transporter [Gammaproteobacteria bacterium]
MTSTVVKKWALFSGPLVAVLITLFVINLGWPTDRAFTLGITLLTAIWWIFEPVPIPVTSLIPLSLFPILGILTSNQIGQSYGSPLILLLLGGFILSTALAKNNAHRRIALGMVRLFGQHSNRGLVFGFMAASAVLSMWISNTATTLMLLPVALAILESSNDEKLTIPLLLGIAYAASVGGIGTPIGTPPNLVFMKVYGDIVGEAPSFTDWMKWGIPVVVIFVPIIGLWLTRNLSGKGEYQLPENTPWTSPERRVLTVFLLTALVWITRKEPFGGWSYLFDLPGASDGSVALISVVILFLVPDGKGGKLLDWPTANNIPWGVLLLFAGGIAIAKAFIVTGLSQVIGDALSIFTSMPILLLIMALAICVTFLTELTSNTATTTLLMPILAATAISADMDPLILMVPAAVSASCAFMLPVATAPNAVIFGSEKITVDRMIREGFVLNIMGALIISGVCYFILT